MDARFIVNNKGETISVIIPINEYEDFLHRRHLKLELTDGCKSMIDDMLNQEEEKTTQYLSLNEVKARFEK
jgi:hypothetical protein